MVGMGGIPPPFLFRTLHFTKLKLTLYKSMSSLVIGVDVVKHLYEDFYKDYE